jgi:hypothetical protein
MVKFSNVTLKVKRKHDCNHFNGRFLYTHNTKKPTLRLWNELEIFPEKLLYEMSKLVILVMLVNDPRKASRVPSS